MKDTNLHKLPERPKARYIAAATYTDVPRSPVEITRAEFMRPLYLKAVQRMEMRKWPKI